MPSITILHHTPKQFNFAHFFAHQAIKDHALLGSFKEQYDQYLADPSLENERSAAMLLRALVFDSIPHEERILYANLGDDIDYNEAKHFTPMATSSRDVPISLIGYFVDLAQWPITFIRQDATDHYPVSDSTRPAYLYGLSKDLTREMNHFSVGPLYPLTSADGNCFFRSLLQIARSAFMQLEMKTFLANKTYIYDSHPQQRIDPFTLLMDVASNLDINIAIYMIGPHDLEEGAPPPNPHFLGSPDSVHTINFIAVSNNFEFVSDEININGIPLKANHLYTADGQIQLPIDDPKAFRDALIHVLNLTGVPIMDLYVKPTSEGLFSNERLRTGIPIPSAAPDTGNIK